MLSRWLIEATIAAVHNNEKEAAQSQNKKKKTVCLTSNVEHNHKKSTCLA